MLSTNRQTGMRRFVCRTLTVSCIAFLGIVVSTATAQLASPVFAMGSRFAQPFAETAYVLRGRVLGADGSPVGAARVEAEESSGDGGASTDTSSTGEYSLLVPAGTYGINAEERVPAMNSGVFALTASAGATVEGETEANLTLPALGTVTVEVLTAEGTPLANAELYSWNDIQHHPIAAEYIGSGTTRTDPESCVTDEHGECTFQQQAGVPVNYEIKPPEGALSFTGEATATEAGTTATITDPYHEYRLRGRVLGADGSPVGAARVEAEESSGDGGASTDTSSTGEYSLLVPAGTYGINAEERVPAMNSGVFALTASAGATVEGETEANLTLPALGTVTVEVLTAEGTPLANAELYSWNDIQHHPIAAEYIGSGTTRTDPESCVTDEHGECTFQQQAGVPVNYEIKPPEGALSFTGEATATEAGTTATITDPYHEYRLRGRVFDADGSPVGAARVEAEESSGDGGASTDTSSTGEYSLLVPAGTYGINAEERVPAMNSGVFALTASAGATVEGETEANLTLPALGTVTVEVLTAEGTPLANAELYSWNDIQHHPIAAEYIGSGTTRTDPESCVTDEHGECTFQQQAGVPVNYEIKPPEGALSFTGEATATEAGTTATLRVPYGPCVNLKVETAGLPAATPDVAYRAAPLAACGGVAPYKWKKTAALPKGLKLTKTGLLTGTPSKRLASGSYSIAVEVKDKTRKTASAILTLEISK